jgi:hypothetical protein
MAAMLAACTTTIDAPRPKIVALPNADLEMPVAAGSRCPPRWGCSAHGGIESHRFVLETAAPAQGRQSLCIERVGPDPWALATLSVDARALHGQRVRFSLAVRLEAVPQGAGPWIVVHGPQGNLLHEQKLAAGTRGWERMSVDFDVAREAQSLEVGGTLEGPGRACIDDARLEIL